MKVVILAGGLGTRLSEETQVKPKPMAEIGEHPILWHIMKIYGEQGFTDFVVCLGYKGYVIKEYFANYFLHNSDVTFDLQGQCMEVHQNTVEPWRVTLVDTGADTQTGGRLRRVAPYVADETFMMTYGDGVADVDLSALLAFHEEQGRLATVSAVQPPGRFGALRLDEEGTCVRDFVEKPDGDGGWMNGGFFVLEPAALEYVSGDETLWEREPLEGLARDGQLSAYRHFGFWQPMDTLRDKRTLEELWAGGGAPLEALVMFGGAYSGRRVFVTGHTGFKGSWLAYWLTQLGAQVTGFALGPPTEPSLFAAADVGSLVDQTVADLRDEAALRAALAAARPEAVFHLAAQPLVRESYARPLETFATNVMGTVNLLEAARHCDSLAAVVIVTSDKCYQNLEDGRPFVEDDAMGGLDPYSASKGCAELVTAAYAASFFADGPVAIASARAGNVIGGGDWATDRLVPDCVRALEAGAPVVVRRPEAVRPWQHVLEALAGYLTLGAALLADGSAFAGPWNFGPAQERDTLPVRWVVDSFIEEWGGGEWLTPPGGPEGPGEAHALRLDSAKARERLAWMPLWDAPTAVKHTAAWYRRYGTDPEGARGFMDEDLQAYVSGAARAGLPWSGGAEL